LTEVNLYDVETNEDCVPDAVGYGWSEGYSEVSKALRQFEGTALEADISNAIELSDGICLIVLRLGKLI
jgi:hypothetical protein